MIEVVIPAHNAARFLREALYSVAAQILRPGRITVVDDASSDNTAAVARDCAAELGDQIAIRVIPNTGPRGPSAARNTAIRQSDADWIALLDADDILAPGHQASLARVLQSADDIVLGFGDLTVFRDTETLDSSYLATSGVLALTAEEIAPDCHAPRGGMFTALLRNGVFATSSCMFRRLEAVAAGLFDEAMMQCEDTDFFLRLSLAGRFGFTRQVVTHKRIHDDNLSQARHKLAFCRGTAISLAKLESCAAQLKLTEVQSDALKSAVTSALDGYLYNASRVGLAAYRPAASVARRSGRAMMAANPRHLVRLLHRWLPDGTTA